MADTSTTPAQPATPAPAPTPPIQVAENGYVYGIDGMLDQICGALARQGKHEWLPVLQRDKDLQATVGASIGRELAKPLWVIAFLIAGYAGYKIWTRSSRTSVRTNPSHYRRSRRSRRSASSLRA